MFVVVDYNTGAELKVASDEIKHEWETRDNAKFIEITMCCVRYKVIIKERKV